MAEIKYEKLDRIREDIKRDKAKVVKLQKQIKSKEAKLKEAESSQIIADVGAMNMSPEQLAEFLALIHSGQISAVLNGQSAPDIGNANSSNTDDDFEEKDEEEDFEDEN